MDSFSRDVQEIIGPVLAELGFTLDQIDDRPDPERGGSRHIVYYRSSDCKMQIYQSSREGEINAMVAPHDAENEFGLRAEEWQYITHFTKLPDLPFDELMAIEQAKYESCDNPLVWLRDRIIKYYPDAHTGILQASGN